MKHKIVWLFNNSTSTPVSKPCKRKCKTKKRQNNQG